MNKKRSGQTGAAAARKTEDITLRLKANGYKYLILFRPDQTGQVKNVNGSHYKSEEFSHTLDLLELQSRFTKYESLRNYLLSYLWEEVNHLLNEPLFDYIYDISGLEDHELEFTQGAREEFDHLVRLFLLTEPGLAQSEDEELIIRSATDRNRPYLERRWSYYSDRLRRLVALALKEHRPFGYTFHYDDEGYSIAPHQLNYQFEEIFQATARERMQARHALREWLVARGQNPAEYGLESWEKIL
jgi:hypothetical protein